MRECKIDTYQDKSFVNEFSLRILSQNVHITERIYFDNADILKKDVHDLEVYICVCQLHKKHKKMRKNVILKNNLICYLLL